MLSRLSCTTFHFPALCDEQVSWNRGEGDAWLPRGLGKARGVWLVGEVSHRLAGEPGRHHPRTSSRAAFHQHPLLRGSAPRRLCTSLQRSPPPKLRYKVDCELPPCPVMVTPWAHATTPPPRLTPGVTRSLGAGLLINVHGCRWVAQGLPP